MCLLTKFRAIDTLFNISVLDETDSNMLIIGFFHNSNVLYDTQKDIQMPAKI
ncbi:hypothetical protein BC673_1482 [Prevotella pallens]|uniref:Uncharacterized protein n=1 Tax=Prevotella pallens TaxID=60133 RepID=A0ABX9DPR5_9BACT|nr:hypothetical protein BC673_1482 [Prevotella pallens]